MKRFYYGPSLVAIVGIIAFGLLKGPVDLPNWLQWLGPLGLSCMASFGLMPPLMAIAPRLGITDHPDERKHHEGAIPLVGGIAIFAGFLVANLHYGYWWVEWSIISVMIGAAILLVVGALDDRHELPAGVKLLAQLAAVAVVVVAGVRLTFLPETWWGDALEIAITAIWLIGLTNALNFLDGIDGLATSVSLVALLAFGLVAVQYDQYNFLLLCATLAGGCLGFLPYNLRRRPAAAFLGDAGSTMLGFSLASLAIVGEWGGGPTGHAVDVVVPLLILGVPIFDTTFITITRIADGRIRTFREWIEYTGRDHIHHRLLDLGLGRRDVVGFICTISAVLSLSAITLKNAEEPYLAGLALLQGAIILTIVGRFMLFMQNRNDEDRERAEDGSTH